jgi:hypothetical protein
MKSQIRSGSAPDAPRYSPASTARHPATAMAGQRQALAHWPASALLGWLACAGLWLLLQRQGWGQLPAWAAGTSLGLLVALVMVARRASRVRVGVMAAGFPLASAIHTVAHGDAAGAGYLPAWLWLGPLGLLLLLYPLRAWRDAPLFPTAHAALDRVAEVLPLPPGARVLDAGCGLGDGLAALRRVWPLARLEGVEWSRPIAWLARLRCPGIEIHRGDMWARSWAGLDVVYLFQRPETMPRALAKARAEMHDGAWLVSLEFEAPGARPHARLHTPGGKPIWIYHLPACGARPVLATLAGQPAPQRSKARDATAQVAAADCVPPREHQPHG